MRAAPGSPTRDESEPQYRDAGKCPVAFPSVPRPHDQHQHAEAERPGAEPHGYVHRLLLGHGQLERPDLRRVRLFRVAEAAVEEPDGPRDDQGDGRPAHAVHEYCPWWCTAFAAS